VSLYLAVRVGRVRSLDVESIALPAVDEHRIRSEGVNADPGKWTSVTPLVTLPSTM